MMISCNRIVIVPNEFHNNGASSGKESRFLLSSARAISRASGFPSSSTSLYTASLSISSRTLIFHVVKGTPKTERITQTIKHRVCLRGRILCIEHMNHNNTTVYPHSHNSLTSCITSHGTLRPAICPSAAVHTARDLRSTPSQTGIQSPQPARTPSGQCPG